MTARALVAADLDRTLIYSRAAAGSPASPLICVEIYQDAPLSFMTQDAADLLIQVAEGCTVVPVTTRTPAQLARVTLPCPTHFAVAANGGVIIQNGEIDHAWSAEITRVVGQVTPLAELWSHVEAVCKPEWTHNLREAAGLFVYAVVERALLPQGFLAEITAWAAERGWTTSLQGRKLYWVPRTLTKSAAVAEVQRRVGASMVLAAGDSLLDIDMLEAADSGIHPGHGEIAESGWTAPHVTSTGSTGASAGEDICRWFLLRRTAD